MSIAIVTVGYNRPDSMDRLLKSVVDADFLGDTVDLVVSIDKGQRQKEVAEVAEKTVWTHGEKIIRTFDERQGLRPHILQCGDLTDKYDAVIVLEDDITVSKGFYAYAKQMVEKYGENEAVSGISLYKHRVCPGNRRPFDPMESPYDVYFMQMAQSWGQCWNKRMWQGFRTWYETHGKSIPLDEKIPAYIVNWNDASWLKYFNRYVVETNTFYVYPYASLSTNHSEAGEHAEISGNEFHVPLMEYIMEYRMPDVEQGVKYDIFFERMGIEDDIFPELQGKKLLDLMGGRQIFGDADYLISVQSLPYEAVRKLKLNYRPAEVNCLKPEDGEGVFVYDLHKPSKSPAFNKYISIAYDMRGYSWKPILRYGLYSLKDAFKRKLKR